MSLVISEANRKKLIEKFDWHMANAPQTALETDGTVLRADEAMITREKRTRKKSRDEMSVVERREEADSDELDEIPAPKEHRRKIQAHRSSAEIDEDVGDS